ncbi:MAG TPA: hemolysin family protein [Mycobacteriales bacterium]|jgi:putative hemolysin|nr:hemolysin family protein [Mycobacteriales bacterium]
MSIGLSIVVVLALIVLEALFVAAEFALVSLREAQVRDMAAQGKRGRRVQRLVSNPNRFLAAVQIGVTLTALLSSAFGAITLSDKLGDGLEDAGLGHTLARVIGFLGVTLVITFVTLVIGELAPKRLALQRVEGTAQVFAGPLEAIASLARPVIWLLSKATDGVVRLLGGDPDMTRTAITEEELRSLVAGHESLSSDERRLIDDVFEAQTRSIREVMRPRTEVEFLDAGMTLGRAAKLVADQPHSRYPVIGESQDDVVGFLHVRDLYRRPTANASRAVTVADVVRPVKLLPASKQVLPSLSEMRREGHHLAIVVDEYGGTAGIVTLEDLIEELVGEIRDEYDQGEPEARRLAGGRMEVDGLLNLDEFAEVTGVTLPDGPYETVAGFLVARLGRVARPGDETALDGVTLAVARMDGRRIDRIVVTRRSNLLAGPDVVTKQPERT